MDRGMSSDGWMGRRLGGSVSREERGGMDIDLLGIEARGEPGSASLGGLGALVAASFR
jgi:hypothetical protein